MSDLEDAVRHCYSTWGETYYDDYYKNEAAYPPVHRDLIRNELKASKPGNLLDAGCGPASILRDLADLDIELFGFDLTPEMLSECRKVMTSLGSDESHFWQGSVTDQKDYFQSNTPDPYDSAICIGVLPHIPAEDDEKVFRNLRRSVRSGGVVMVEARNELFSLFTLNRYSNQFFEDRLIPLNKMKMEIPEETESILEKMKQQFRMDLPPLRKGKADEPGYDEVLSRTHNPFEVREQFQKAGFRDVRTLFYHFHALPPMFEVENPHAFRKLSIDMEADPQDWRGHFMASAFLMVGVAE